MKEVQAFITNISFPKTLDEFLYFLEDDFHFNVDDILNEKYLEWSAPRWSKIGDIVFFMHSKTAISTITRLRTEFFKKRNEYTADQQDLFEKGIEHALDNYKKYGGKIYAIGRVIKPPIYDDFYTDETKLHWGSRIYAPISDVIILENPIDISEFNNFIFVSRQSAITGVFGKEYTQLKDIVMSKNKTKEYFEKSISSVLPIKDINASNWLQLSNEFRRCFFLESQFRSYYVDYLLDALSDNKVYKECPCKTDGKPDYFVDNVIFIESKPLLVEVKLNIENEKDLPGQMSQYCNCNKVIINNRIISINDCYHERAIIIDTSNIYLFDNKSKDIISLIELDKIKNDNDIKLAKEVINKSINKMANKQKIYYNENEVKKVEDKKKDLKTETLLTDRDIVAVEMGDSAYLNNVGAQLYADGEYEKARIYYELAATMGDTISPTNLGYIYMYGRKVPADYSVALAFYKIGAKQGNIDAIYKLGNLYQSGKGVEKDEKKALMYYHMALEYIAKSDREYIELEYPSVFFTVAKEMMPGGLEETDLEAAYNYLNIACCGYDDQINEWGATYYKNTFEEAKKLLNDPMFDEYRKKDEEDEKEEE